MVIGVLKEVKLNEYRVALVPDSVNTLVALNHRVLVEKGAGSGANFSDEEYEQAGATIVEESSDIFKDSDLVLHVRRPHEENYHHIREGQIIMTFFHSANNEEQTRSLLDLGAVGIAYEMVKLPDGSHPLLASMSEIAGKMAPLEGAKYLEKTFDGAGIFLGGIPGVEPARVVVIGSGVVGMNTAKIASAIGADVVLMGLYTHELRKVESKIGRNITTLIATPGNIKKILPTADVVVGAVHIEGHKALKVVSRADLQTMKEGSILIDVAIDQGGCFETSRPTTHQDPIYKVDGIIHYCVPNMAGAYARTASITLSNTILPYVAQIAAKGWQLAAKENESLAYGIQFVKGKLVKQKIGELFGIEVVPLSDLLQEEEATL